MNLHIPRISHAHASPRARQHSDPVGIDIHDDERRKALERFYNMAMDGQFEGIMVKDLTAAYDIGGRSPSWIKVKPDYGGHTRDLDMIVVGAHFAHSGSNYRSQGISRFTCAVVDQDPKTGATTYHTACRVATGYSFEVTSHRALDGICIHSEAILRPRAPHNNATANGCPF